MWPCASPGSVRYTSVRQLPRSRWLRCAGRPPVTAQAPMAMRILQFFLNSRSTSTFSALQMPPSIRPMSHGPQCLMSVSGERSNSTRSSSGNRRSSISRNDMWQPKQPASEVVARRNFFFSVMLRLCRRARRIIQRLRADRTFVIAALTDGHAKAHALYQDYAHRADMHRLVFKCDVGVLEQTGFGLDDELLGDAAPGQRKYIFAVHF